MKAYRVFFNSNPLDTNTDSYWIDESYANTRRDFLQKQTMRTEYSFYDVEEIEIKE